MTIDPFRSPLCECPDTNAVLMAEIEGKPRPLCGQHDANAIKARQVEKERTAAEANLVNETRIIDDVSAKFAAETADRNRVERDAAEAEARSKADPLALMLGDAVGAPDPAQWGTLSVVPAATPIGDDRAIGRMLETMLNGTANPDDPSGPQAS